MDTIHKHKANGVPPHQIGICLQRQERRLLAHPFHVETSASLELGQSSSLDQEPLKCAKTSGRCKNHHTNVRTGLTTGSRDIQCSYQWRILYKRELHNVCSRSSKDDVTESCSVWANNHLCSLEQGDDILYILLALEDSNLFRDCR